MHHSSIRLRNFSKPARSWRQASPPQIPRVADYSVETQKKLGLVGNGNDDTHGNFDLDRVQKLIDETTPIFTDQGTPPKAGLTPDALVTNQFIDTSISAG